MTDIVERLRQYDPDVDSPDVVLEAADEIEQLRRMIERLAPLIEIPTEWSQCVAWHDGEKPTRGTHTCNLVDEHDGPHHCPICDGYWTAGGIVRGQASRAEEEEHGTPDIAGGNASRSR